ncbi:MAG: M48 family metalloprotease [Bacteroidia bacterium]|nr:M48 family metalloprotease [Bacteroidia bacterium]
MKNSKLLLIFLGVALLGLSSCRKDDGFTDNCGGKAPGGAVGLLMSISQDAQMGLSSVAQIEADPTNFPVLDSTKYPVAYGHIYRIRDNILNSGKVYYKNEFPWRIRIIKDDKTLNAFCTPGGYIYVYTGIIKFLDNETQLAGVLGHEIAHADRRHSANQMLQQYGVDMLIQILSGGNPSMLAQLGAQLLALKFSRSDETEADDYSVRYLLNTEYDAQGAKYFFQKISGSSQVPEFLSTHPNPDNRVSNIEETWKCLGSGGNSGLFVERYNQFKSSLP